jgi:hypothetical protein
MLTRRRCDVWRQAQRCDDRHGACIEPAPVDCRRATTALDVTIQAQIPGPDARPRAQDAHRGDPDHPRLGVIAEMADPRGGDVMPGASLKKRLSG